MYIIAGLGNPGPRYANTRHNIGFIALDMLAEKLGIKVTKIKHKALIGEGTLAGEKIILAKPQTYMNLSGESILDLKSWYKVEDSRIIIIYDDIDLDVGVLRIRPSGSAGTHNGMRSIIYQLQSQDFPRVRLGIGRPPEGWDLKDYVLSTFRDDEIPKLKDACQRAVEGVELIITKGVNYAMSRCNG
ncbi:MAG: aminoacyl-tRNA hydrolase [Caldicoprobacterales bacterium]|nr:aminoacyl-tRNA hydrolase [Clostridiales bacterium]